MSLAAILHPEAVGGRATGAVSAFRDVVYPDCHAGLLRVRQAVPTYYC